MFFVFIEVNEVDANLVHHGQPAVSEAAQGTPYLLVGCVSLQSF